MSTPHSSTSFDHEPAEDRVGRLPADGLVDRAPQQLAVVAHRVEQRGIRSSADQQDAELAPGRARARGEDESGEPVDLVVGEEVALAVFVDLALDELVITSSCGLARRSSMTCRSIAVVRSKRAARSSRSAPHLAFGRALAELERLLAGEPEARR